LRAWLSPSTIKTIHAAPKLNAGTFFCAGCQKHLDGKPRGMSSMPRAWSLRLDVYRMISRFRATRKASSLLPYARGTPSDAKRLDGQVERVIVDQIDRFWLKKEKPKMRSHRAHP
jgi:hypothetical protein